MRTQILGAASYRVDFESEEELAAEERASLAVGGLLLRTPESLAPDTQLSLTLSLIGEGRGRSPPASSPHSPAPSRCSSKLHPRSSRARFALRRSRKRNLPGRPMGAESRRRA